MHAAIASSPRGPIFYWNVDDAVGSNGANKFDDVLFVKWCFYKLGKWPAGQGQPWWQELRGAFDKIGVNGECSGRDGDLLVDSIKALQRGLGTIVDGRVSPATKGGSFAYAGGRSAFLIIFPLNAVLQQMHPGQYPRIDLMPEFVWKIKDEATAPFLW